MSLQQWQDNGWIWPAEPSRQEIAGFLGIAEREIADASLDGISSDGRFAHAYTAVRALCDAALHVCGYSVPKGQNQHQRVIESLQFTLAGEWVNEVDFLDRCRRERHGSLYDRSGVTEQEDADQLLATAERLLADVREWLGREHPELV
jgi:hypothetical protein